MNQILKQYSGKSATRRLFPQNGHHSTQPQAQKTVDMKSSCNIFSCFLSIPTASYKQAWPHSPCLSVCGVILMMHTTRQYKVNRLLNSLRGMLLHYSSCLSAKPRLPAPLSFECQIGFFFAAHNSSMQTPYYSSLLMFGYFRKMPEFS